MFLSRFTQQRQHDRSAVMVMDNKKRRRIQVEEMDDPLLLYEQSIANHSSKTAARESVKGLFEEAINKYNNDVRYKNSPRYLRLYFMYILYLNNNLAPSSSTVLPILYKIIDNHIGDKLASLYEAMAYYQLQQKRILDAEATLLLGIHNKAEPTKRLKRGLETLYIEEKIDFDIYQYSVYQQSDNISTTTAFQHQQSAATEKKLDFHNRRPDSNETVSTPSSSRRNLVKSQLLALNLQLDRKLEQSLEFSLSKLSLLQQKPIEEIQARERHQHDSIQYDDDFLSLKKDMEKTLQLVKSRKTIAKKNEKKEVKLVPAPPKPSLVVFESLPSPAPRVISRPISLQLAAVEPSSSLRQPERKKTAVKKNDKVPIKPVSAAPLPASSPAAPPPLLFSPPPPPALNCLSSQRPLHTSKPLSFSLSTKETLTPQHKHEQQQEIIVKEEPKEELKEPTKSIRTQHTIPTIIQEKIVNVVQLPHNSGFVQKQLTAHGLLERDTYHHLIHIDAQAIKKKLQTLSSGHKKNKSNSSDNNQDRFIQLQEQQFHVVKKLGEGGMAQVYLVQNRENLSFFGLKVQQPPFPWEFYILNQLHKRKQNQHEKKNHLLPMFDFYHYKETSMLLMAHLSHGTLLDALNLYRRHLKQPHMPEEIVLLFVLQLLQEIGALHRLHVAHNDLKLDNVMLAVNPKKESDLPTVFMIDFGRSIDLLALPTTATKVKANWPPAVPKSDFPMLNKEYDPKHADYWQLATMAHLLLYGIPMGYSSPKKKTKKASGGGDDAKYRITQTIKRYWYKDVWNSFFDVMLNPPVDLDSALQSLIQKFQNAKADVRTSSISTFLKLLNDEK